MHMLRFLGWQGMFIGFVCWLVCVFQKKRNYQFLEEPYKNHTFKVWKCERKVTRKIKHLISTVILKHLAHGLVWKQIWKPVLDSWKEKLFLKNNKPHTHPSSNQYVYHEKT